MKRFFTSRPAFAFSLILLTFTIIFSLPFTTRAGEGNVNINSAKFEELTALPGVDEVLAAKILKYRKENNGFKTKFDILKIPEMNGELFEKIQGRLVVSDTAGSAPAAKPAQPAPAPPSSSVAPSAPAVLAQPDAEAPETGGDPAAPPSPASSSRLNGLSSSRIAEPPEEEGAGTSPATTAEGSKTEGDAPDGISNIAGEGRTASPKKDAVSSAPRSTRGRIDEARRVEINPENYYKVIISLMRLGKYDKAEDNIREFLGKFPSDARLDDMTYLLGACTEEKEKYRDAIEIYKKIYDKPKSDLKAISLFRMAICFDLQGNTREALENYRKYVSEFSDSAFVKDAEERINTILKVK